MNGNQKQITNARGMIMSVSKKDFAAVAKILKQAKEDYRGGTPVSLVLDYLDVWFADYFESENDMFDRGRFIKACELGN